MSGTWPHDLLGIAGAVLLAGAYIWGWFPPRRRHR